MKKIVEDKRVAKTTMCAWTYSEYDVTKRSPLPNHQGSSGCQPDGWVQFTKLNLEYFPKF